MNILGRLLAVGGPSHRTKSGIDLTHAAKVLGVSRRTVERWVKTAETGKGQQPSPDHDVLLAKKARQVATTKAGRKESLATSGMAQAALSRGARISVTGMQGPRRAGLDYLRRRTTQLDLDPDQVAAMMDAWEQGGDKGFMKWLTDHYDSEYLDGWGFLDPEAIEIERPYGGGWH